MMAGFGAKVKLTVDRSSTAKAEFNQQINDYIKEIKISNKFKVLKKDIDRVVSETQDALNDKPLTIKVKKIDCSAAVKDLQGQLQAMVNSLSIKNGVKITGLVDPTGTGNIETQIDDVAEAAKRGQAEVARMAGQLKVLSTIMGTLNSSYKTVLPGGKNALSGADLASITSQYNTLQGEIAEVNALQKAGQVVDAERIARLQREALAIQEIISLKERERITTEAQELADKKAADAAAKAAAKQLEAEQKAADKEATKAAQTKIKEAKQYETQLKKVNDEINRLKQNLADWTKARKGSSYAAYAGLGNELNELEDIKSKLLESPGKVSKNLEKRILTSTNNIKEYRSAIKVAGEDTKSFGEKVKGLFERLSQVFSVTQMINALWRAMKQMVSVVIEVDTAMTELRKVTDETEAAYSKFLDTAHTRAKAVGATLTDTITATADFARLGYDIDEASSLADAALVYKNVGDGIEDIAEASESVISVMQAFGVSAKDAMQIVDKFNAVGNNFAISSGGVGEAMLRSAAAMKAANNTLDETIALAAAANTIVQDPQKVGTTLKTVSMFLRAAKTEAEEAGESTDGMANSVSELRAEILALTGNKVDIQIDEDTFKSTYQILKELSGVWDDLTDVSQANILELVGGKRNSNVVAAILENFDVANRALEVSINSAGSALAENEKYLDSIQGKIAEFKATFQDLATTTVGSDMIKGVVEFGTSLLGVLETIIEIIDKWGGLKTVLLAFGGFKLSKDFEALKTIWGGKEVEGFSRILTKLTTSTKTFVTAVKNVPTVFKSFRSGTALAVPGVSKLDAVLKGLGLTITATQVKIFAITAVISGLIAIISRIRRHHEEQREAAINATEAYDDMKTSVDDYISQAKDLRKELDDGNLSEQEAYEKRAELAEIQEQVIGLLGDEAENINLVTGELIEQEKAIRGVLDAERELMYERNFSAVQDAAKLFTRDFSNWGNLGNLSFTGFESALEQALSGTGFWMDGQGFINSNASDIYETIDAYWDLYHIVEKTAKEYYGEDEYLDHVGQLLGRYSERASELEAQVAESQRLFDLYAENTLKGEKYKTLWEQAIDAREQYNEALEKGNEAEQKAALAEFDAASAAIRKAIEDGTWTDEGAILYVERYLEAAEDEFAKYRGKLNILDIFASDNPDRKKAEFRAALSALVTDDGLFDDLAYKNIELGAGISEGYTSEQIHGFVKLKQILEECGLTVDEFSLALVECGVIAGTTSGEVKKLEENMRPVRQSYEKLSAAVQAAGAIQSETNNIFIEGGQLTEETYNAVVELAGGEEALADCIDKTNGYLITNAKALADVVSESENLAAQNIQIAKSHQIMDFHKLTMEMYRLKMAEEDLNDENKAAIANIERQLTSIDRQIARFRMLEQQLMGATNAYVEFANAQEYDAEMDYSDDMVGMLDGLIKAYENHEFGTEAFWASFKGIVPEDVYSQFEDVGDQINAGWAYINSMLEKGYFSYDNGNIEINFENVKRFVEDGLQTELFDGEGISLGTVFTGNLEDFELNDSIKSVEQLAEALGITTEMAFMLGTQISKYDASNADFFESLEVESVAGKLLKADKELLDLMEQRDRILAGEGTADDYIQNAEAIAAAEKNLADIQQNAVQYAFDSIDLNEQINAAVADIQSLNEVIENTSDLDVKAGRIKELDARKAELDELLARKRELGVPEEMIFTLALDDINAEIASVEEELKSFVDSGLATFDSETATYTVSPEIEGIDASEVQAKIDEFNSLNTEKAKIEAYVELDPEDVLAEYEAIIEKQNQIIDKEVTVTVSGTYTAKNNVQSLINTLNSVPNISRTVTITTASASSSTGGRDQSYWNAVNKHFGLTAYQGNAHVRGTWGTAAPEKNALLGELGQELIVDPRTGTYYTVGDHGAEFVDLPKGAIIFNHKQTEGLLKNRRINSRGIAYAKGNAYFTFLDGSYSLGGYSSGSSGGSISGTGANANTAVNSNSGEEAESWFEKLYKYHQHLLAMDAENVKDYLNWLNGAFKDAYAQGVIDLDDFYQYEEEVYTGLQDLFKDYLNDAEHEISMRENYEGEADKILAIYEKLIKDVTKEIEAARDAGLDDTDAYIQELQNKYQDYTNAIQDIRDEAHDDAKDAVEELIEYRIDMIKKEIEEEKDALSERLGYLKDFVDKQKELLQDRAEEDDYLKEQDEKRKTVSDLENELSMLERDDSAWAQKRKLELEEELKSAKDELNEFEEDHALNKVLDTLDKVYESQEGLFQDQIDKLDEKLNDPEALYNQALNDIRTNTGKLYGEMLEYNRKFGTGNDDAPKEVYEEAYKALLEYKDIYGQNYKDIILPNSTGYAPKLGSWDTDVNSGTNPDNYRPPKELPTYDNLTPSGGYGSNTNAVAPALTQGSYVEVKSGTRWYENSFGGGAWGWASGGTIQYINQGATHPYNINGAGWVRKEDIVGYASGTDNATPGLHMINEDGEEAIFTSADGTQYKLFRGGEKVFNAPAADFLYRFANAGSKGLLDMISDALNAGSLAMTEASKTINEVRMGDIIIQGNADEQTVSEIRRVQRENVEFMLKEFNRLKR